MVINCETRSLVSSPKLAKQMVICNHVSPLLGYYELNRKGKDLHSRLVCFCGFSLFSVFFSINIKARSKCQQRQQRTK